MKIFFVSQNSNYRTTDEVKLFPEVITLGMGKKGDVSFVLVVLVALAGALAALGVVVQALLAEQERAEQFDMLLSELEFQQAYALAAAQSIARVVIAEAGEAEKETLEEQFREYALVREKNRAIAGTHSIYAALQREENVKFSAAERGYVLEVKNIAIEAKEGQSSIKRVLDARIDFTGNGAVESTRIARG